MASASTADGRGGRSALLRLARAGAEPLRASVTMSPWATGVASAASGAPATLTVEVPRAATAATPREATPVARAPCLRARTCQGSRPTGLRRCPGLGVWVIETNAGRGNGRWPVNHTEHADPRDFDDPPRE